MKHLYALITALGIEFSPSPYARGHDMSHRPEIAESGDYHSSYDDHLGYDYDQH